MSQSRAIDAHDNVIEVAKANRKGRIGKGAIMQLGEAVNMKTTAPPAGAHTPYLALGMGDNPRGLVDPAVEYRIV